MSNTYNTDWVVLAEKQINEIHKDHKDPYHLAMASVWVCNANGEMTCRKLNKDVYELLADPDTIKALKDEDFFGVLTCGWAAPVEAVDEDTPPSWAVGRRRVRLFVTASDAGAISVLRFQDNPDEYVLDEGQAKGSLADAVMELMENKNAIKALEEIVNGK